MNFELPLWYTPAPWPRTRKDAFRYAQFCSLARAAEVLGHRWNLLILRELFHGPDALPRPPGPAARRELERARRAAPRARGARRDRASASCRPRPSVAVYELTEDGRAFWPAFAEITRWGARFLLRGGGFQPGDHTEPDWLRGAVAIFARSAPTPAHRIEFRVQGASARRSCASSAGPAARGSPPRTRARPRRASPARLAECLGVIAGFLDPTAPPAGSTLRAEGDAAVARAVPRLFEIDFGSTGSSPGPGAPPH